MTRIYACAGRKAPIAQFRLAADLQQAASGRPHRQRHSHADGTEEAAMHPMISAELTRSRIADQHRSAQRDQLASDGRQARRHQRRNRPRTVPGRPASVLTSHALALFGARPGAAR
jgi:hypothetical protein